MSYPTLRFVAGPEQGRELPLPGGTSEIGSEVSGPGRLEGPGVAPRHAEFMALGELIAVSKRDGEVLINGVAVDEAELKPGDMLTIGEHRLRFETPQGDPPQERAWRAALEAAAAGGQPYRMAVRFQAQKGEKTNGVLEAGAGMVQLITPEGATAFRLPLSEVGRVSTPPLRNAVIELSAGGLQYSITLIKEVWIQGEIEFKKRGPELVGDSSEVYQEGEAALAAIELALRGLGGIADRMQRKTWKEILEGRLEPEMACAEAARTLLSV